MSRTLNLRLPEQRIELGKELAREYGTSVSALVSDFFAAMAVTREKPSSLPPLLDRLAGSIPLSDDDPQDAILEELEKKYGENE